MNELIAAFFVSISLNGVTISEVGPYPEEAAADRAAHDAYLAEKYDAEYLADCAYYGLEEC
jgi:hypothetical protein